MACQGVWTLSCMQCRTCKVCVKETDMIKIVFNDCKQSREYFRAFYFSAMLPKPSDVQGSILRCIFSAHFILINYSRVNAVPMLMTSSYPCMTMFLHGMKMKVRKSHRKTAGESIFKTEERVELSDLGDIAQGELTEMGENKV